MYSPRFAKGLRLKIFDRFTSLLGGSKMAALDIGTNSLKLAEVDIGARGPVLKKFSVLPLEKGLVSQGEVVDIGGVGKQIEAILKLAKVNRRNLVSGVNGSSVIVKKISMPRMDDSLVAEQIKWEAEQYIPFDINEVSLDYHVLAGRQSAESMEVLLIAVKQEVLFRAIEAVEMASCKLQVADVAGFALANCFEANYGLVNESVALLNIGAGVTNFVVIERGDVVFCRDIPVGGDYYTSEIAKGMSVSETEAEALKISASLGQEAPAEVASIVVSSHEQVVDEIRNSFEFFSATAGNSTPVSRVYLAGGSQYLTGLGDSIGRATNLPYENFNPFLRVTYDTKGLSPEYINQIAAVSPIALGLALRKQGDR